MEESDQRAKRRVLVVEDDQVSRESILYQLEGLGLKDIDVVENGEQAIRAVSLSAYSIILMDCEMPIMDGFEATRLIRSQETNRARTPIIGVSSNTGKEFPQRCLAAGMDGFIGKPASKEKLGQFFKKLV